MISTFQFNGYELSKLLPPVCKSFSTTMRVAHDFYIIAITNDMKKYMRQMQMKYCKKESQIKDVIFSAKLLCLNQDKMPMRPAEGSVIVELSMPRLIKKDAEFYPKFEIKIIHGED